MDFRVEGTAPSFYVSCLEDTHLGSGEGEKQQRGDKLFCSTMMETEGGGGVGGGRGGGGGENCAHGGSCYICAPIPEGVVAQLEKVTGLDKTMSRKAAFTVLKYLKEHRHTSGFQEVMKYIQPDIFEGRYRPYVPVKNVKQVLLTRAGSFALGGSSGGSMNNNAAIASGALLTTNMKLTSAFEMCEKEVEDFEKQEALIASEDVIRQESPITTSEEIIRPESPITTSEEVIRPESPITTSEDVIRPESPIAKEDVIRQEIPIVTRENVIRKGSPIKTSGGAIRHEIPVASEDVVRQKRSFVKDGTTQQESSFRSLGAIPRESSIASLGATKKKSSFRSLGAIPRETTNLGATRQENSFWSLGPNPRESSTACLGATRKENSFVNLGAIPQALSLYSKEQQLLALLRFLSRQNGAWGIFEEEYFVLSHLFELTQLLTVLDSPSIKRIARCDRYTNVKGLCLYFALEKRWLIRSELVNALELLAVKDKSSTSVMMKSDLPADLAKDIYREYMDSSGDQSRILSCCNLLVTLLRGECSLRFDHFDRMDSKFVFALLQISEGLMQAEVGDELRDAAVAVILAYNTHFEPDDDIQVNHVVRAISGREEEADYLKQKMMHLLLNREIGHFNNMTVFYPSSWCAMVVKLGMDLLCSQETSGFFMENDLNIFLAGLGVYIPEIEIGDEKRTSALRLARLILCRLNHQHPGLRRILQVLKCVLTETDEVSFTDQKIARKIARDIEGARLHTTF